MGKLLTAADCNGANADSLYTNYGRYPFFSKRAALLKGRFSIGKYLVVGCGPGYLVDELVALGIDAYGIDLSPYAIAQAAIVVPAVASRIMLGDASKQADMNTVRTLARLTGGQRFRAAISEDCLPVCADAEVTAITAQMRRVATNVFHIITCTHKGEGWPGVADGDYAERVTPLNWHSQAEYRAMLGSDPCYDTELKEVF